MRDNPRVYKKLRVKTNTQQRLIETAVRVNGVTLRLIEWQPVELTRMVKNRIVDYR